MDTITCPLCGFENSGSASNCTHCQIDLKFALENPEDIERIKNNEARRIAAPDINPVLENYKPWVAGFIVALVAYFGFWVYFSINVNTCYESCMFTMLIPFLAVFTAPILAGLGAFIAEPRRRNAWALKGALLGCILPIVVTLIWVTYFLYG